MDELIVGVAGKIAAEGLSLIDAAAAIGVTSSTLKRHLEGEYVRSDSAAKYRRWLAGKPAVTAAPAPGGPARDSRDVELDTLFSSQPKRPSSPYRVVDLFSGCGGLSLGFELLDGGGLFESVLAVDIEAAMLQVLDGNRTARGARAVGRRVDLSDLTCEAEALAFYLDHLVSTGQAAPETAIALERLPNGGLPQFKRSVAALDRAMLSALDTARSARTHRSAVASVSSESLKQTSVLSFHTSLRLPAPGTRGFDPPVLWWDPAAPLDADLLAAPTRLIKKALGSLESEWEEAVAALRRKATGRGRGQLASSSRRINDFIGLLDGGAYDEIRDAWLRWRSARDALRTLFFDGCSVALREAYAREAVDVVLGGPPCQGFSRIGRGKIRSLRESGVQAHTDDEAGDERNRLLFSYVLMVSALRPRVFLFENVRHFQAEVRTGSGVFRADEVLAEAIADLTGGGVTYGVDSRVLRASDHGVPQTRERFFMAGVLAEDRPREEATRQARWLLHLPVVEEVPLRAALEGLPAPLPPSQSPGAVEVHLSPDADGQDATSIYLRWVRQGWSGGDVVLVDGHVARSPRDDDAAWFQLMGPGKRWMDYRVDRSATLEELRNLLTRISGAVAEDEGLAQKLDILPEEPAELLGRLDGSAAIRMLLECIAPHDGELAHHLLTPGYLAKREGQHGDWLARLAADKPCKTITSHMGKDTYAYVHPFEARTMSLREAARVQSFPDAFALGSISLVDGFRVVGNAVPPLLSAQLGARITRVLPPAAD